MNNTLSNLFTVKHVDWIKKATIYEVYIRQYTESGTINAFAQHLPRLKDLGVDILWLMPIQPIGEKNRKGSMGSPYAIRDYLTVNPDFGSLDDFKKLVKRAHEFGMFVILDWVANHTAWDHTWIEKNPEFYSQDNNGNIIHPVNTDWYDVADLNFNNQELRHQMIEALKFWVKEANIDGYRCDMAGLVPTDFWETVREELDKIKPIFMLAEAEQADLHYKAFDVTYNWAVHHLMNNIAKGQSSANSLDDFFNADGQDYGENAIRMYFTSNHDENKNAGSAIERLGDAYKTLTLLTYTLPGIPLIFSGQEVGLNRKLMFFEKDLIDWNRGEEFTTFYKQLILLRKKYKALWSGKKGGKMQRINSDKNDKIYAFTRKNAESEILAVFNLSHNYQDFNIEGVEEFKGAKSYFTGDIFQTNKMTLPSWGYQLYMNGNKTY